MWSNRWGARSYPLPSPYEFTLLCKDGVDVQFNNRICHKCWNIHRGASNALDGRVRVIPQSPPPDPLLDLLCAAESSPQTPMTQVLPPISPQQFFSPPTLLSKDRPNSQPSLPPLFPSTPTKALSLSETTHHNIMAVRCESDGYSIGHPRRAIALGKKRKVLNAYMEAGVEGTPPSERVAKRRALLEKENVSHKVIAGWRTQIDKQALDQMDSKKRLSTRRKRAPGGGRNTVMTHEQEEQLDKWIEERRRCEQHLRVTEVHIRLQIKKAFDLEVGEKCVRSFMKRWKWAVRVRTTTKQVTGKLAQEIKE